jgi:hypothetical protein
MSRCLWGTISTPEATTAAYYVHWTLGRVDHGANFDLIVGKRDSGATREDGRAVSLAFRVSETGPQFMVINAAGRRHADLNFVQKALARQDVIGTAPANEIFAMADAILEQDGRIAELAYPSLN